MRACAFLCIAALVALVRAGGASTDSLDAAIAAYETGRLVEARRLMTAAAEQGSAEAQFRLGMMLVDGEGGPADPAGAVAWLDRAAAQGHMEAQYNLGVALYYGAGGAPDLAAAVRWYQVAAENGVAEAMHSLGTMHITGRGVARDIVSAYVWLTRAAENGDDDALHEEALVVGRQMTSEQRLQALDQLRKRR